MSESRNFSLRTAAIAAVAIAVLVVAFGVFTRVRAEQQLTTWTSAQSTPIVSVITPKATGTGDALTLPGNVQALNSAAIFARTTGYVRQWYVDIGDTVHTGQTLAVLDAPDLDPPAVPTCGPPRPTRILRKRRPRAGPHCSPRTRCRSR